MVSSPIRSPVASGPILWPKQVTKMRSTSSAVATPSITSQAASLMVIISTRFETKPG